MIAEHPIAKRLAVTCSTLGVSSLLDPDQGLTSAAKNLALLLDDHGRWDSPDLRNVATEVEDLVFAVPRSQHACPHCGVLLEKRYDAKFFGTRLECPLGYKIHPWFERTCDVETWVQVTLSE